MRYAVIMAGGAGLRLWPLSRAERPKQMLHLVHGKSLLRLSFERVAEILEPSAICVITGAEHLDAVATELPEVPRENLFGEPMGRDTANAVGMAAAILHERDPDATMGIFTADHVITPVERFVEVVGRAFDAAEQHSEALVTMGIVPRRPDTGFGYVERGDELGAGLYRVRRFAEKPDVATAKQYVSSGNYYWNSGMFAWRVNTILEQLKQHLPESHTGVTEIARVWNEPKRAAKLESVYPHLPKISIDFAVMEKAPQVLVVEMDCRWVDVGNWSALSEVVDADEQGNVLAAERTAVRDARNNVLVSDGEHLIAAFGVEDLVIVHAGDATLVCRREYAQALKELVGDVTDRFGADYS